MRVGAGRQRPAVAESEEMAGDAKRQSAAQRIDDETRDFAKKRVKEIDEALSQQKYAGINKEFDDNRKGKRYDPPWYNPLLPKGQRNLRAISKAVGRESVYLLLIPGHLK